MNESDMTDEEYYAYVMQCRNKRKSKENEG